LESLKSFGILVCSGTLFLTFGAPKNESFWGKGLMLRHWPSFFSFLNNLFSLEKKKLCIHKRKNLRMTELKKKKG